MNKKFEAVPVEEWKRSNPERGQVNVILKNGNMSFDFYDNDFETWFTGEQPTHVLVPISEQWIRAEDQKRQIIEAYSDALRGSVFTMEADIKEAATNYYKNKFAPKEDTNS